MKINWHVIIIALCVMNCSGREPRFEFASPANSILFSFDARDIESIVDTTVFMIQLKEHLVRKLSGIKERLIGGTLRISLSNGKNVSLRIRHWGRQDKPPSCPYILADNTGVRLSSGYLIIEHSEIEGPDESECQEMLDQLREILKPLKDSKH